MTESFTSRFITRLLDRPLAVSRMAGEEPSKQHSSLLQTKLQVVGHDRAPRIAPAQFNRVVKTVFRGGALTVEELAQLCDVHVSIAERVIARLVARGLLRRSNHDRTH